MIISTLGLIYTPDLKQVLLIEKQKPASHKGQLNGLGGKCETNEQVNKCIAREIKEEANILIPEENWLKIGIMDWEEWNVHIFATIYNGDKGEVKALTKDSVKWYEINSLPNNVISNIPWLILLGIDCLTNKYPPSLTIKY